MMKMHNEKIVQNFKVPELFNQKVTIITDGEINQTESALFHLAMRLVESATTNSSTLAPPLPLNVYFLESNTITLYLDDMLGCFHQAIIFPIGQWRKKKYMPEIILATMVEELCHAIWLLPDGAKIEEKVREIYEQIPLRYSDSEFLMKSYVSLEVIFSNRD